MIDASPASVKQYAIIDKLSVSDRKISDYLLNLDHPEGAGRARFFEGVEFRAERWEFLAEALQGIAANNEVSQFVQTEHGSKYIVDGELETPAGRSVMIRTV